MELSVDRSLNHWWVFLIRGLLFIALGIWMIASPGGGFAALGFAFGLVILLTGVGELLHVLRSTNPRNRGWHLFLGIVDIILGVMLMGHLAASVAILRIIVGAWFVFRGVSLMSFARIMGGSWLLSIGGFITVVFGLLIVFDVAFGSVTLVVFTAMAFILAGIFNAWLGIWMRPKHIS